MQVQSSVLIVDNDPNLARVIQAGLVEAGYAAQIAHHAGDAVQRLASAPVDVVVIDRHLDHTDGLDVVPALRAVACPQTAFLLVTAEDEPELADRAAWAGVSAVFLKPFDLHELAAGIQGALATKHRDALRPSLYAVACEVSLRGAAIRGRARSRIVSSRGDTVVVSLERPAPVAVGAPLTAAMEAGDGLYEFRTRALASAGDHLTLEKPGLLRRRQRRAAVRVAASWQVTMSPEELASPPWPGLARDISLGGMGVSSLNRVAPGAVVQLSWHWPRTDAYAGPVAARVCRCEPVSVDGGPTVYRLAFTFAHLPAAAAAAIDSYAASAPIV